MIHTILSVYDGALGAFGRPVFAASRGVMLRSFQDEVNRVGEENQMNKHPEDFDLYELGKFVDQTGRIEMYDQPQLIANAVDVVVKSH